jgi:crotonobetainyl-CoA:carnitine CoA-transferase CaiB-like acyl-CoA transferase
MWVMIADARPLAGITVVTLEQAISAPFASRQLADLGATVIKVERPEGDFARRYDSVAKGNSAFFVWANRGKQSVTVDLADPADAGLLDELIAGADVFLHNMSADAAARRGLEAATLHRRFPSLIACEISGYGSGGPREGDKAYDLAIQAEAGAFSVNGDGDMSKTGFSVADISAGMYALTSILAALTRRERTGEGAEISVAMLDSLVEWLSAPLYAAVYGKGQAERTGRRHHAIAPYGTFPLSDGRTLLIAVQSDAEWRSMAEHFLGDAALGDDPRFATNPARLENVGELEDCIREVSLSLPAHESIARLESGRTAFAWVNDLPAVWQHDQLRARDRFHEVNTEHGPLEMFDPPFVINGLPTPLGAVPALGEHDEATITAIRERGRASLGR